MSDNLSLVKSEPGALANTIIFDIETAPLSKSELAAMMPTEWATGNIKDPDKIKAAIAAKEKAWLEDAALDALTGRVLAVGIMQAGKFECLAEEDEAALIKRFWDRIQDQYGVIHRLVGFNSHSFDLPFLVRRSWKRDVIPPIGLRRGRYWSDMSVDLREVWQLGDKQARGSLDVVAKHLGVGAKSGSGLDFAGLWIVDRPKALAYLQNDLELTQKIAQRLGIV